MQGRWEMLPTLSPIKPLFWSVALNMDQEPKMELREFAWGKRSYLNRPRSWSLACKTALVRPRWVQFGGVGLTFLCCFCELAKHD